MNNFSDTEIWLAVAFAFAAGYMLVSFLARLMKTEPPPPVVKVDRASSIAEHAPVSLADKEKCAQVLGVSLAATEAEIEQAYRQSLAKYHPDKVADLGGEFSRLAAEKIKEIEEAYAFLKRRRGVK
jgi:DnaJ-domain-containing protein 1